jgi:hypothetical protein
LKIICSFSQEIILLVLLWITIVDKHGRNINYLVYFWSLLLGRTKKPATWTHELRKYIVFNVICIILVMSPRLAPNSQSSCLGLRSSGITSVCQHSNYTCISLKRFLIIYLFFIYMCIHCLGHFSPLPSPLSPAPSLPDRICSALFSNFVEE